MYIQQYVVLLVHDHFVLGQPHQPKRQDRLLYQTNL